MHKWLIIGLLLSAAPAFGQFTETPEEEDAEPRVTRLQSLQEKANQLLGTMRELGDWDQHYESLVTSMESMYEQNGWDAESDLFSLEMAREIGAIPPWNPQERIDVFMEMVGDRYLLDEGQLATMQQRIFEVNIGLFSRHSDRILEYATEAIQTRAAGEPFTPEQVGRWVELAEPVMLDARSTMKTEAESFAEELDPEQLELFEQDLKAGDRRMDDLQVLSVKWKRGEWSPRDWGMENDPIQMQGSPAASTGTGAPGAERGSAAAGRGVGGVNKGDRADELPPELPETMPRNEPEGVDKAEPQADDAWARYVKSFIQKYKLNDQQQQRCWLLYKDAKTRDDVFDRRFERRAASLRSRAGGADNERVQARLSEQVEEHNRGRDRLFSQLKRRLDRLPTRAQHKDAAPGELKAPLKTTENAGTTKP